MAQHDELAVPERDLQPPSPPAKVSYSAVMKGSIKCDTHGNPMAVGLITHRVTHKGNGSVSTVGEVKLTFIGCKCHYWRPLK